jgi:hypothetical protein
MRFFTVTTLVDVGNTRTPAIFTSFDDAKFVVEGNDLDIAEREYIYAVIEEIEEGLYPMSHSQHWYKWEGDWETGKYVPCEKPEQYKRVVAWGIG